jgi:hypothetical protein
MSLSGRIIDVRPEPVPLDTIILLYVISDALIGGKEQGTIVAFKWQ